MDFSQYFPIWSKLTDDQRQRISQRVVRREVKKGTLLHDSSNECTGLLLVRTGQLRAYILSDEGREITIYTRELLESRGVSAAELDEIEAKAQALVDEAEEFALNSPEPDPAHVMDDVFYEGGAL